MLDMQEVTGSNPVSPIIYLYPLSKEGVYLFISVSLMARSLSIRRA